MVGAAAAVEELVVEEVVGMEVVPEPGGCDMTSGKAAASKKRDMGMELRQLSRFR